jgi:phosphoserine phosphatase RsbU/P
MPSEPTRIATANSPVELKISDCPILVVDDDEMICEFIRMNLLVGGFENIDIAMDGAEALAKVKTLNPDLMILDMSMPVLDGFAVLKELRGNPDYEDLPVLVTTGLDTHEDRNNVLRHGASNLISKPIDSEILIQRTKELLERRLLLRELTRYRNRLEHELSAARDMQSQIVPSAEFAGSIAAKYNCKIESHYRSSSELGGDFWGIRSIDEDRFMVFTADFSGHGVAASLNTFRLDAIIKEMEIPSGSPAEFLALVNSSLYTLLEPGQFATTLCAFVEPGRNRLVYSGAAAPEPIFGRTDAQELRLEDGSGMLLGVREGSVYDDREVAFPNGSFMFLFSDALFESPTVDGGDALEIEGVMALAKDALTNAPAAPLEHLLKRFDAEVEQPLNDDLTTVWLSH